MLILDVLDCAISYSCVKIFKAMILGFISPVLDFLFIVEIIFFTTQVACF